MALVKAIRRADRNARWQRIFAYVLIVIVTLIGFARMQEIVYDQCKQAQSNRIALRNQITATAGLGMGLVEKAPEPSRSEAISRFQQFQNDNLKRLPPIDC